MVNRFNKIRKIYFFLCINMLQYMARRSSYMKKDFNVLIIEDEKALAEQIEKMLKDNCKYITKIEIAENGEIGLQKIIEEMPDFIILNQYMPGITGLEMLERCHSLELKLPEIVVITGGINTKMEVDRFYELGVKYICRRPLNDIQERFFLHYIEESYKTSTKLKQEDMIRIIEKETRPILNSLDKSRTPYQVTLLGFLLKYLVENNIDYDNENKEKIYNHFKEESKLDQKTIDEIQEVIEGIIEENYTQGNMIRKMNYLINKDEIQEEFFHKLKENVFNEIIAESN